MSLDERPRGSTRPTPKVHYNSLPRTSIEGALGGERSSQNFRLGELLRPLLPDISVHKGKKRKDRSLEMSRPSLFCASESLKTTTQG
jgi:hypothetical protein